MAKVICKGTLIQQTISMSLTTVAQVISIDHAGAETITYNSTALDSSAGLEYANTGYAEGGTIDCELFYDPSLAGHQAITDDLTTPTERAWSITFQDSTTMAFDVAGVGFGFTVAMEDGLKGSVSLKLDQLATYPT